MLKQSTLVSLLVLVSLIHGTAARAQSALTWDANTTVSDIQNGSGTWSMGGMNWWDGSSNLAWPADFSTTAAFGSGAAISPSTVTVAAAGVSAAGLSFLSLGGTLSSSNVYTISGGTISMPDLATLQLADASSTGSAFVTINSGLVASNLTIQKSAGTAIQFLTIGGAAGSLTGTLTIKGNNGGVFVRGSNTLGFANLAQIVVESGSVFDANFTTGSSFAVPITIAGFGSASDYGAIRVDQSNTTLQGQIRLSADAGLRTNIEILNTTLAGGITELAPGLGFQRYATSGASTLTISGASNYTGATSLGRTGTNQGGITTLDFAAAGVSSNVLYQGVTPGALNLIGGSSSTTSLVLRGASGAANAQSFAALNVSGNRSSITLTPSGGGSMNLSLGNIARTATTTAPALLSIALPARGAVSSTSPDGLLGPWATVASPWVPASWAMVKGGRIAGFTGDMAAASAMALNALGGASSGTHFRIDSASTGSVIPGASTTTDLATITFADTVSGRTLDVGSGKTLRFAATGGLQMVQGSSDVVIGEASVPGTITAGGAAATAGALYLTNLSGAQLTVNSAIANNGSGAVAVVVNGNGRVVFSGANSYTGMTTVAGGSLEIQNNTSLGTTAGTTLVLQGASLRLNGNLSLTETITVAGTGVANDGALRSVAGSTLITSLVATGQTTRINADSGSTLTFTRPTNPATTDGISGANALTLGGGGDIIMNSRLGLSSSALTKDGTGTVTLRGTNVFTGATTINGGTLLLDFPNAATATNILYNGVTGNTVSFGGGTLRLTANPTTASAQTIGQINTVLGNSAIVLETNGSPSLTLTASTFARSSGGVMNYAIPAGSQVTSTTTISSAIITQSAVAYATFGTGDWAAVDGTSPHHVVGLSTLTTGGYTPSTATTVAGNADVASGIATTTLASSPTLTSLRFNQPQATTITQSGARILTTGGILVTPNVGANLSTISVGTLRTAATAAGLDLVVVQNNTAGDLLIGSAIVANSSANAFTKAGPGKVILTGVNTYAGATRVYDGTLQIAGGQLAATNDLLLGSGATSGRFALGSDTTPITVSASSIQTGGYASGNAIVGAAPAISTLNVGAGTSNFTGGTLGGSGTNENNLALTLNGGFLQLGPANTYAGDTRISSGTVEVSALASSSLPSSFGTAMTPIVLSADAASTVVLTTLRYTGAGLSQTDRALSFANSGTASSLTVELDSSGVGAVVFTSSLVSAGTNTATRTVRLTGTSSGPNALAGVVDDGVTITTNIEKTGTGRWELTGASSFHGTVTVKSGVLAVSGSLSGAFMTVGDSSLPDVPAVVAGTGHAGSVFAAGDGDPFDSGAAVAPGAGPGFTGILQTEMLSIRAGAHLVIEVNGTATEAYDRVVASGAVTLTGGDLQLTLASGLSFQPNDTLTLLVNNSGSAITDAFATLNGLPFDPENIVINGQQFELRYDALYQGLGTDGVANDIVLVPVPEPTAVAAIAFGIAMLLSRRPSRGGMRTPKRRVPSARG